MPRSMYNMIQFKKDKQCQTPTIYVNVYMGVCMLMFVYGLMSKNKYWKDANEIVNVNYLRVCVG